MASKKEWKQRAKDAERRADELFDSAAGRAAELAQIDTFLMDLQLPGPSMRDWAYQMRDALLKLAEMRGLPTVPRAVMTAPDVMTPEMMRAQPGYIDREGDGMLTLPTEEEILRNSGL